MVSFRETRKEERRELEEIILIKKDTKNIVFNVERQGWYYTTKKGSRKRIKEDYINFDVSKSDFEDGRSLNPNSIPHGTKKLNKRTGMWFNETNISLGSHEQSQLNSYLYYKITEGYEGLDSEIKKTYNPKEIFNLMTHTED